MGKDIEAELTRILSEELSKEIDKQIIEKLFNKRNIRRGKIGKIFKV